MANLAEWISAVSGAVMAVVAVPAVWFLMQDRQRAKSAAITMEPYSTFRENALGMRVTYRGADPTEAYTAIIRVLDSNATVQERDQRESSHDPEHAAITKRAPPAARVLKLRMGRYLDENHDARSAMFDVLIEAGASSKMKCSVINELGKAISSRRIIVSKRT